MSTEATPSAEKRFGKYQLLERIGRGGMAEVWRARMSGPAGFARIVVIKRVLPEFLHEEAFVRMFVEEARVSAQLNHTNIVQVFELGDMDGEYFLAMEYLRGRDLRTTMQRHLEQHNTPPPPGFTAYAMREVSRALAYAHTLSDEIGRPLHLIHRDVSPSNVMLVFDGAVKLLDFGIAKALSASGREATRTGALKGKLGYLSPERVNGKLVDHRADLFAVGVILHECLTGKRLFHSGDEVLTLARVREARVEPPSTINPAVPPELDAIVLRALAREPDDRYSTGSELAVALDGVLHELKWGAHATEELLSKLFGGDRTPAGNDLDSDVSIDIVAREPTGPTRDEIPDPTPSLESQSGSVDVDFKPPRRRTGILAAIGLGIAVLVSAGWLALRNTNKAAVTSSAPPAPVAPLAITPPPSQPQPVTTPPAAAADVHASPTVVAPTPPAQPPGNRPTTPHTKPHHAARPTKAGVPDLSRGAVVDPFAQ